MSEAEMLGLLRKNNELLTLLAKCAMADVLERELADPKQRALYQHTDGKLTVRAISKEVGLATGSISRTWQRWEQLGLLVRDGNRYRRTLG